MAESVVVWRRWTRQILSTPHKLFTLNFATKISSWFFWTFSFAKMWVLYCSLRICLVKMSNFGNIFLNDYWNMTLFECFFVKLKKKNISKKFMKIDNEPNIVKMFYFCFVFIFYWKVYPIYLLWIISDWKLILYIVGFKEKVCFLLMIKNINRKCFLLSNLV